MSKTIPISELSATIGISTRAIRDLVKRGIIARVGDGFPWPQANLQYTDHLRQVAAGRGGLAASAVSSERARWLKAKADRAENENRVAGGEFVPAGEVEREWSARFASIKRVMLALPARLSWLDRTARNDLDRAIRDLLEIDRERRSWLTRGSSRCAPRRRGGPDHRARRPGRSAHGASRRAARRGCGASA